jgi:phosphoglycolate phosphatase-like HAD superfamily hydrolase
MYDCGLFDVDGVLVDVRKSYNLAIKRATEFMLGRLSGRPMRGLVTDKIILKFRQSGGFNNDADTTYAIALATLSNPPRNLVEGRRFLLMVAENADETGIVSIEKFMAPYGIEKWKDELAYPAPVSESALARVFDELFYGPELFKRQNGLEPKYWKGKALINNDVQVVAASTLRQLHELFGGRLAMVTGRSRVAADYSLKKLTRYFDLDACVFLEDEKREYAKPNPYAIRRAMESMDAKSAVYSGDSAEDLLMARRAEKETGTKIAFVGIYGFSPDPSKTLENFGRLGVRNTARTVNRLPGIIKGKL